MPNSYNENIYYSILHARTVHKNSDFIALLMRTLNEYWRKIEEYLQVLIDIGSQNKLQKNYFFQIQRKMLQIGSRFSRTKIDKILITRYFSND